MIRTMPATPEYEKGYDKIDWSKGKPIGKIGKRRRGVFGKHTRTTERLIPRKEGEE